MDRSYETGCLIAFFSEIIAIIFKLIKRNSIEAKNLSQVGLVYSLRTGSYTTGKKANRLGSLLIIITSGILNTILSWVTIGRRVVVIIKGFYDKISTPDKIKEINYKLSNGRLTKDEVLELARAKAELLGKELNFNKSNDLEEDWILEFDNGIWFYTVIPNVKKYTYKLLAHTDDRMSSHEDIRIYKFEGFSVLNKLLDRRERGILSNYDQVKDGIILESEILTNEKDSELFPAEFEIEKLKKIIERSEMQNYRVQYFLIYHHKKDFNSLEFNQFFRKEIEKVKMGILEFNQLNQKFNIERKIMDDFFGPDDENISEKEAKKYNQSLKELLEKYELYRPEKDLRSDKIELIEKYLNS